MSALANVVDDLVGLNRMHSCAIARDLDRLAVSAEAAAASLGVGAGIEENVRAAILTVAAQTYSDETQLVVIGTPADLAELTGTTPANADDLGSYAVRFAGAKLYPTLAASPDVLTVFAPGGFRVFQAPLQSASLIDPASGAQYSAVGCTRRVSRSRSSAAPSWSVPAEPGGRPRRWADTRRSTCWSWCCAVCRRCRMPCAAAAQMFDSEDPADVAEAVGLCRRCPELGACRAWVDRLDYTARPTGVVAGRRYHRRRRRRGGSSSPCLVCICGSDGQQSVIDTADGRSVGTECMRPTDQGGGH